MAEYLIKESKLVEMADMMREKTGISNNLTFNEIMQLLNSAAILNFNVVGGTVQPTNPIENTIWVNTNTQVNGWHFSIDRPETQVEGALWIKTWPSSVTAFNVVKQNSILVYPIYVTQYINGAWTNKEAYMYVNNSWNKLDTERILFDATSPFAGMTGLWSSINGGSVSETQLDVVIHYSHEGSEVYTTEPIDLSLYNTLHVQVSNYHTKSYMGIITTMIDTTSKTSFDSNYAACAATKGIDKANTEFTLDLTSTTGSHHIWIGNTGGGAAQNYGCNVTKVWLTM